MPCQTYVLLSGDLPTCMCAQADVCQLFLTYVAKERDYNGLAFIRAEMS